MGKHGVWHGVWHMGRVGERLEAWGVTYAKGGFGGGFGGAFGYCSFIVSYESESSLPAQSSLSFWNWSTRRSRTPSSGSCLGGVLAPAPGSAKFGCVGVSNGDGHPDAPLESPLLESPQPLLIDSAISE